jgi:hypothetical protein
MEIQGSGEIIWITWEMFLAEEPAFSSAMRRKRDLVSFMTIKIRFEGGQSVNQSVGAFSEFVAYLIDYRNQAKDMPSPPKSYRFQPLNDRG